MSDFLAQMEALSRVRAAAARATHGDGPVVAAPAVPLRSVGGVFGVIAEVKGASPAEGVLRADMAGGGAGGGSGEGGGSGGGGVRGVGGAIAAEQAQRYVSGPASWAVSAVSVLTEPERFLGALGHVSAVRAAIGGRVAVMRKDFLVDPAQIAEARAAGADGVLLIARSLPGERLGEMLRAAAQGGCSFVIVEVFDEADAEHAAAALAATGGAWAAGVGAGGPGGSGGPGGAEWVGGSGWVGWSCERLVGVNTRDLRTLRVDPDRLERLRPRLPAGYRLVAESGIAQPADAARAAELGYQMALVGTALMRAQDPAGLIAAMSRSGTAALRARGVPWGGLVKVCGVRDVAGVESAVSAGADMVGFVLSESVRRVGVEAARRLADRARALSGGRVRSVAVLRRPEAGLVRAIVERAGVDLIQSDAADEPLVSGCVRGLGAAVGFVPVYRDGPGLAAELMAERSRAGEGGGWGGRLVLIEGPQSGAGVVADWGRVGAAAAGLGYGLAGGLGPGNVGQAIAQLGPVMVDTSSGVESSRGIKDGAMIAAFVSAARGVVGSAGRAQGAGRSGT
ncbi:MAG: hypothetical protein C0475_03845 [Planctomyces sp.]|nr:hypothetical protein [Planctomyces sp.]